MQTVSSGPNSSRRGECHISAAQLDSCRFLLLVVEMKHFFRFPTARIFVSNTDFSGKLHNFDAHSRHALFLRVSVTHQTCLYLGRGFPQ